MQEFFSTQSLGAGGVRHRWDQIINGTYRGLHVDRLGEDFEAQLLKWRIGGCTLSWPRAKAVVLERWRHEQGTSHRTIVMHLQHRGSTTLLHRGNRLHLEPGHLAFCAGNEYSRVEARNQHEVLVVEFGLDQIRTLVPDIDDRLAIRYSADRPLARTLHSAILSFWRDGAPSICDRSQAALETALCALTAGALNDTACAEQARASTLAARLAASVAARFHNPHLTIGQVARKLGVTPRALQLTMARVNTTPQEFIRDYRLERAQEMLRHHPERRITQIAYDVGFSDSGYFTRCFQKKYGMTPRVYRARN